MPSTELEPSESYNEALYEEFWRRFPFLGPERLSWFPAIKALRFPVQGTHVMDLSKVALEVLERHGAIAHRGLLADAHFPDASFDLVGMFEVLEHVPDDEGLLGEIARMTRVGGHLVLTVPLGVKHFNAYDRYVGHVRRFEPDELRAKVERAGYVVERFEVHAQSVLGPVALFYVWVMRNFQWLTAWTVRFVFLPLLERTRIEWHDAARWELTRDATDIGVIFRRI